MQIEEITDFFMNMQTVSFISSIHSCASAWRESGRPGIESFPLPCWQCCLGFEPSPARPCTAPRKVVLRPAPPSGPSGQQHFFLHPAPTAPPHPCPPGACAEDVLRAYKYGSQNRPTPAADPKGSRSAHPNAPRTPNPRPILSRRGGRIGGSRSMDPTWVEKPRQGQ